MKALQKAISYLVKVPWFPNQGSVKEPWFRLSQVGRNQGTRVVSGTLPVGKRT